MRNTQLLHGPRSVLDADDAHTAQCAGRCEAVFGRDGTYPYATFGAGCDTIPVLVFGRV